MAFEVNYILYRIDLKVKKGELIAIVGAVGSGKSSLVAALMGEMVKLNGRVNVSVCCLITASTRFSMH